MSKYDALCEIAALDIGYTENPPGTNNNKFGIWYGMNKQPWCMCAVQYWHNAIGGRLPYRTASCSELLRWYKKNRPHDVYFAPRRGFIAIFNFGHTGIVESFGKDTVTCIEGNTSAGESGSQDNGGGVFRRTRHISTVKAFIDGISEEEAMTKDEILKAIGDEYIETFDQLPSWAKKDMRELLDAGIINGGTSKEENPDDIRMFLSDIKTIIAAKRIMQK